MASIFAFIKKLFGLGGKKKPEQSPAEVIDAIIAGALSMNLRCLDGEGKDVTVRRVPFAEVERLFRDFPRGFLLSAITGNEQPRATLVIPDVAMDRFLAAMGKSRTDAPGDGNAALDRCARLLEGRLMNLFFMDGEWNVGKFFRIKKTYALEDRKGLLWHASGCAALEAVHGDNRFMIMLADECDMLLKEAVKNPGFADTARELILAGSPDLPDDDEGADDEIVLSIKKPREFILGNVLLPVSIREEPFTGSSRFHRIIVTRDGSRFQGFGVLLHLTIDGARYSIWYCFLDGAAEDMEKAGIPFDAFFKALLKGCMIFLKSNCRTLQISSISYQAGVRPDLADFSGHAVFCASLRVDSLPLETAVAVPREFLDLLFPFFAQPWENLSLGKSMKNLAVSALSLNRSMFHREVRHFLNSFRGADAALSAPLSCLPFFEFMDLVDDRDMKIIVQNFLVPQLAGGYMSLFNVERAEREDDGGKELPGVSPVKADYDRLRKFLPRRIAEDDQAHGVSTRVEDFDRVNRLFMENLHGAVRSDRLVLSYRARFILKNQFHDTVQQNYLSLLEELKRKGMPGAAMKKIGQRSLAIAAGRLTNRALALALMGDEEGARNAAAVMGEKRAAEFIQDREFLERKYREEAITPEEVYRSMVMVQEELEREMQRRKSGD